jgi:hypothetical protein
MTLFPQLSNFLFSPAIGGGLAGLVSQAGGTFDPAKCQYPEAPLASEVSDSHPSKSASPAEMFAAEGAILWIPGAIPPFKSCTGHH